ncbi:MAG: tRNA pseudouridine(55) synthase TruB [bacterium]|nr:tRNA pseudouridine(55) synthase TruB [bacterium]
MKDGLLLIDKHEGCTSHDIVASARRILRLKKIGHCGTLDPAATGLLLLTVGRATRLTRFLIRAPKVYEGSARFGITTDTYDTSGEETSRQGTAELTPEAIDTAMESFVGNYLQTPPPYCAKKVGGVKYYELARRGEQTPDEKKEVTVFEYHALEPWQRDQDLDFLLSCASGTYARSLVHELGQMLDCGAVLSRLRRTRIGSFRIDDAVDIETLRRHLSPEDEADAPAAAATPTTSAWIPFDDIPLPFDEIVADAQQERRIQHGQSVLIRDLASREGDWIKVLNRRHQFIAVGSVVERIGTGGVGVVQPKVVFH